jgi:hypothetical protein
MKYIFHDTHISVVGYSLKKTELQIRKHYGLVRGRRVLNKPFRFCRKVSVNEMFLTAV